MSMNKREFGFSMMWVNASALIAIVMVAVSGNFQGWRGFMMMMLHTLIFSNAVGCIGALSLYHLAEGVLRRRKPLLPVMLTAICVVVIFGSMAAQLLIIALGMARLADFWRDYVFTLRFSLPLTFIFGLGALMHGLLRDRLQQTENALREKALSEETQRKLAAEARLQLLESRLHPHFLFNTLNAISALIVIDRQRAERAVERLATLLRSSLDNSARTLIPLREELQLVESYLELERERFGARLRCSIEAPEELLQTPTPPMSVQTLAENAVKHGVTPMPDGGRICIRVRSAEEGVRVSVSDSGPGFELTQIPAGHGLDNLTGRLDLLFGDAAGLSVYRREDCAVVEMTLPR